MAVVEVCWADLDALAGSVADLHAVLDSDERARADRFRRERDRTRFIARRGLLRELLGDRLGCAPADISYALGPYGKPSLADGEPRFSASHSSGIALFAIAEAIDVGGDIERVDETIDFERMAEWLFAAGERRALREVSPCQRRRAFFRCWTHKEAYVKGLGSGLSQALDEFDLSSGMPGWSLASFEPVAGFPAAIAVRSEDLRATLRPLACGRASTGPDDPVQMEVVIS